MDYVCADCGNEQNSFMHCQKCGSIRVGAISVIADLIGPNWRDSFKEPEKEAKDGQKETDAGSVC